MPVEFNSPSGKKIQVESEPNLNLLAHAQIAELSIGSLCGGKGICGGDKVKIQITTPKYDLSEVTNAERQHLSHSELQSGFRLACQCFPNNKTDHIVIQHL